MFHRFFLKIFISLIFLFIFSIRFVDLTFSVPIGEHPLSACWDSLGITLEEVEVEAWQKIGNEFWDLLILSKKAGEIEKRLRLTSVAPPLTGEEKNFAFVNLDGNLSDGSRIIITLQSTKNEVDCGETFIGLVGLVEPQTDLQRTLRRLERDLAPLTGSFDPNLTLSGWLPGRASEVAITEMMRKCFSRIGAKEIVGAPAGEVGSWTARSSYLERRPNEGKDYANLGFAYWYDEKEQATKIAIGTPAIIGGY